jgi:hypothetical protein
MREEFKHATWREVFIDQFPVNLELDEETRQEELRINFLCDWCETDEIHPVLHVTDDVSAGAVGCLALCPKHYKEMLEE